MIPSSLISLYPNGGLSHTLQPSSKRSAFSHDLGSTYDQFKIYDSYRHCVHSQTQYLLVFLWSSQTQYLLLLFW